MNEKGTFTFYKLNCEDEQIYKRLCKEYVYWHDDPFEDHPFKHDVDIFGNIKWFSVAKRLIKFAHLAMNLNKLTESTQNLVNFMVQASSGYEAIDYDSFPGLNEYIVGYIQEKVATKA